MTRKERKEYEKHMAENVKWLTPDNISPDVVRHYEAKLCEVLTELIKNK